MANLYDLWRHVKALGFGLLALTLSGQAHAQNLNVGQILPICELSIEGGNLLSASDEEALLAAQCVGMIKGVAMILHANCALKQTGRAPNIPEVLVAGQPGAPDDLIVAFVEVMKRAPELWDRPAPIGMALALSRSFECVPED